MALNTGTAHYNPFWAREQIRAKQPMLAHRFTDAFQELQPHQHQQLQCCNRLIQLGAKCRSKHLQVNEPVGSLESKIQRSTVLIYLSIMIP